jgi:hypothetical protein
MTTRTKILAGVAAVFLLAQLYRPAKNQSNVHPGDILATYPASAEVQQLLKVACNDCHSNYTVYPWYAEVQPVASWLAHHVEEGCEHLNFSTFTQRKIAVQNHKFEEIIEMMEKKEMPLNSYTWTHRDAVLNETQQNAIIDWAKQSMENIKNQYPADSLVLKRKS